MQGLHDATKVASLRRGVDVNDFERALARFMSQHLAPGSQPDAAMFNAMLRLMFDYGITMPAEWSTSETWPPKVRTCLVLPSMDSVTVFDMAA